MDTAQIEPVTYADGVVAEPPSDASLPRERSGAHALWTSITALCLCAAAVSILIVRMHKSEERAAELERSLHEQDATLVRLADAQRELSKLRESMAHDLDQGFAAGRAETASVKQELEAQTKMLVGTMTELKTALEVVGRNAQEGRLADRRELTDMSARLASSEEETQRMRARVTELTTQVEKKPQGGETPDPAAGGAPVAEGWKASLPDLASPNPGTRWQAVDALGQSHDPVAAVHVIPMLKDSDVFVRMAAARVLGELRATNAIKPLIDALEDPEAAVREAAHFALCAITGRDQRFDAHASEPERAKRVKAWRDWWKKMEEESGASSG